MLGPQELLMETTQPGGQYNSNENILFLSRQHESMFDLPSDGHVALYKHSRAPEPPVTTHDQHFHGSFGYAKREVRSGRELESTGLPD